MDQQNPNSQHMIKQIKQIESSCQYLTHIRNTHSTRARQILNNCQSFQQYSSNPKDRLSPDSFAHLLIELGYFLYACRNQGNTPVIQMQDLRVQQCPGIRHHDKKMRVVVWYRLDERPMPERAVIELFTNIAKQLYQNWQQYLANRQVKEESSTNECQAQIMRFFEQLSLILSNPYFQINEVPFFMTLEKTDLFYEYSLLYRIKNSSIIDFVKTNEQRFQLFCSHKKKDRELVVQYNKQYGRNKGEEMAARDKERKIQQNLQSFFEKINKEGFQALSRRNDKDQSNRVNFNFKLKQRSRLQFSQYLRAEGQSVPPSILKRPLSQMFFEVDYFSENNRISVKLFMPNIRVTVQNSDFLMVQSNVLTYDSVNVSIQLSPFGDKKNENMADTPKIVTFKGNSSFPLKEPPLQKILLLMDITMIASKIYEPELNSSKYSQSHRQYNHLFNVSKQISHYTKFFMRIAKKIYD